MLRFFSLLAAACLALFSANLSQATVIDSINASATPGSNSVESIEWASNGQGWFYTPSFSYTLTGISTNFGPANTSTNPAVTPTITVQIQTDRPVNGGTVLGQGTFQGSSLAGGIGGASFSPVSLIAGHAYFVDFLNDTGMGINVGLWQNVGGVPTPSNGATVNLGTRYYDLVPSTGFAATVGNGDYDSTFGGATGFPVVQSSGAEPILFFSGTPISTPEPSSFLLLAIGGGATSIVLRARARRA
jgi:hypothetical protein